MPIPLQDADAPPRVGRFWPTLPITLLILAVVAFLGWKVLNAPPRRVSPAAARTWMTQLDSTIAQRAEAALYSEERIAVTISPDRRRLDPDYLDNLARATQQAGHVRRVLLAPASIRFQKDLIADIGDLSVALNHCGERRCADVIIRLRVLTAARADSVAAFSKVQHLHARSYTLARESAVDSYRTEDIEAFNALVGGALNDEKLLALSGTGKGFADVNHYSTALWEIIDIHREMMAAYAREHRFMTLLRRVQDSAR